MRPQTLFTFLTPFCALRGLWAGLFFCQRRQSHRVLVVQLVSSTLQGLVRKFPKSMTRKITINEGANGYTMKNQVDVKRMCCYPLQSPESKCPQRRKMIHITLL
ncbi:hypothetical protein BDZ97DRAFT_816656 [Flammula alnicola]|nr:hypothetical protein BDZ97DRAFT_816656 [Flammula alnicola]